MRFWTRNRWRLGHISGGMIALGVEIGAFMLLVNWLSELLNCTFDSASYCNGNEAFLFGAPLLVGTVTGVFFGLSTVSFAAPRSFLPKHWVGTMAIGIVLLPISNLLTLLMWILIIISLKSSHLYWKYIDRAHWLHSRDEVVEAILGLLILIVIPGIVFGLGMAATGTSKTGANDISDGHVETS